MTKLLPITQNASLNRTNLHKNSHNLDHLNKHSHISFNQYTIHEHINLLTLLQISIKIPSTCPKTHTNKCECWYLISKINCIIHVSCHRKAPLLHNCYIQLNIILDSWLLRMDRGFSCKKGFFFLCVNWGEECGKLCSYIHGFDG